MRHGQDQINRKRNNDEDEAKGQAESEVSLAGFESDGRRHGARVHADIAAEHHGHADLGDDSPKPGNDGGDESETHFTRQLEKALHIAGPECAGSGQNSFIRALNRTEGVISNHRGGENGLTDDDGSWSKEKSHRTKRPLPAEKAINQEADDNGGHRHQAIQHKTNESLHRKFPQSDRNAKGNSDDGRKQNRPDGDAERSHDSRGNVAVSRQNQGDGYAKRFCDKAQALFPFEYEEDGVALHMIIRYDFLAFGPGDVRDELHCKIVANMRKSLWIHGNDSVGIEESIRSRQG